MTKSYVLTLPWKKRQIKKYCFAFTRFCLEFCFRQPFIETALERKPILFSTNVRILRLNFECVVMRKKNSALKLFYIARVQIRFKATECDWMRSRKYVLAKYWNAFMRRYREVCFATTSLQSVRLLNTVEYFLIRRMLSTSFSTYVDDRERHNSLICQESYFRVNMNLPTNFLFRLLHTFSMGFASGDCEGHSKSRCYFPLSSACIGDCDVWGRCPFDGSNAPCWLKTSSQPTSEVNVRRFGAFFERRGFQWKSLKQPKPRWEMYFPEAHVKLFCMWTPERRGFGLIVRYCTFASVNLRLMVFTLTCSPFSSNLALVSLSQRVGSHLNIAMIASSSICTWRCSRLFSSRQVIDSFSVSAPLHPDLLVVLRFLKHFSISYVWKVGTVCMGAQETRFKTFSVVSTHYAMLCYIRHFVRD